MPEGPFSQIHAQIFDRILKIQLRNQCEKVYFNDFWGLNYVTWRHQRQNSFNDLNKNMSLLKINFTFEEY